MSLNSLDWHGIWHKDASIQQLLQRYKKRVNRVNRGTSFKALRSSISWARNAASAVFVEIWVWINTYENTIFRGMNIHLPAILMFTRGTIGFDTLPYVSHGLVLLGRDWKLSTGLQGCFSPSPATPWQFHGLRVHFLEQEPGNKAREGVVKYVSMDLQSCQINLNV